MSTGSGAEQGAEGGAAAFARAVLALEAELDWRRLGELYCHTGGEDRFPPAEVEAIRETGLLLADDVVAALGRAGASAPRKRSLYVGAAVAELVPALCETLVLGRHVVLTNLPNPESTELARALAVVSEREDLRLPRLATDGLPPARERFDHVWMTSVLTDPERFPALHDRLYGRRGEHAAGGRHVGRETREARALVEALVARLAPPAIVTTTDEEAPFFARACRLRGLSVDAPGDGRLSAIVGDTVRVAVVRAVPGAPAARAPGQRR